MHSAIMQSQQNGNLYANCTVWLDLDAPDQNGNNISITLHSTKEAEALDKQKFEGKTVYVFNGKWPKPKQQPAQQTGQWGQPQQGQSQQQQWGGQPQQGQQWGGQPQQGQYGHNAQAYNQQQPQQNQQWGQQPQQWGQQQQTPQFNNGTQDKLPF